MSTRGQVIIQNVKLPKDRLFLDGIDTTNEQGDPTWPMTEFAKNFFGRTRHWVRWLESKDAFRLDGKPIDIPRGPGGARRYDLATIEKIAHGLKQQDHIDADQMIHCLLIVHSMAVIWGFIDAR